MSAGSFTPTPYAVICLADYPCKSGDLVFITQEEYRRQLGLPNNVWVCPRCGYFAEWSDDNYQEYLDSLEETCNDSQTNEVPATGEEKGY
jgi:hypothetical protein